MSLFDNPLMAAFAIAAPEMFGAEAALGTTTAEGATAATAEQIAAQQAAQAAAEEAARQEAARIAAEEAAKKAAGQGILQANTAFTGALPEGFSTALPQAGPGIDVAGPMQMPPQVSGADRAFLNSDVGYEGITGNADRAVMNSNMGYQGSELPIPSENSPTRSLAGAGEPSTASDLWNGFTKFAGEHPYITGGALYTGAYNLGLLDPRSAGTPNEGYNGSLSKYRMSPNFQGRSANPLDYQYAPRYAEGGIMGADQNYPQAELPHPGGYSSAWQSPMSREPFAGSADTPVNNMTGEMQQMASGGIAHFAKGNLASSLDFYTDMMDGSNKKMSSPGHLSSSDVGIYQDMDPDTRYQDALTAAQIRQAKVNKRANMQLPAMKRPTPMGALNLRPPGAEASQAQSSLDPENAAHGGIMQAHGHLGGYAAGGNPRLLKGPGDGMSDNIPATIAGKQPARLADGEFVVPADVVSHLGNGSTDAGAKKLHEMMTKVRKARTGNPKQGKQINPNKFTPK